MAGNVHPRLDALTKRDWRALDAALLNGLGFLGRQRDAMGLWHDFQTLAGRAIDWVSGYVVTAIATLPGAWRLCEDARVSLLARQRTSGGWGYNHRIPPDADSTAWALRGLLGGTSVAPHCVHSALEFLERYHDASGGYSTFRPGDGIGAVIGEPCRDALRGWRSSHVCVTAAVTLALLERGVRPSDHRVRSALDFLTAAVDRRGLLQSYWWNGPCYATYHGVLALLLAGRLDGPSLVATTQALLALQNPDAGWGDAPAPPVGSDSHAFATAHALLLLTLTRDIEAAHNASYAAARWLLSRQLDDGSWAAAPILRIPDAHVMTPGAGPTPAPRPGTAITVPDDRRCYTTATVLNALHRYRLVNSARLRARL